MVGHGTVPARLMEGGEPSGRAIEWIIRLAFLTLAVAAVWTVFGDDITQILAR